MANEDPGHLALLRAQQCAVAKECFGVIQAHHSTYGRGMSQKTHDHDAFPLCAKHHAEFHCATGHFRNWNKAVRAVWQRMQSAKYRPKPYDPEVF